jgi:hypothetical protein
MAYWSLFGTEGHHRSLRVNELPQFGSLSQQRHRACVTGFRIERNRAPRFAFTSVYTSLPDHSELGKEAVRRCHAAVSKSIVGISLSAAATISTIRVGAGVSSGDKPVSKLRG